MISFLLTVLNSIFWCILLYPFALLRLLVPYRPFQNWCRQQTVKIGENFIDLNSKNMDVTQDIVWKTVLPSTLSRDKNYLVIANHLSWVDIIAIQKILNRKIPFIRFFLKQELIWVPLLGVAWWALDFPFMKRHSKETLRKNPDKRGDDLKTIHKAMEKFRDTHFSILNFLEGTRMTAEKHARQASPYKHLLSPKVGGFAFALSAMRDQLHSVLDVTIVYPKGVASMGQAMNGLLKEVVIHVREIKIPAHLLQGNYLEDAEFRIQVQAWVKTIWAEKDQLIEQILSGARAV
jgi:1-acyl-sn-glycerol-3-phosphate acyltransferase